jgi:hypothetical protein
MEAVTRKKIQRPAGNVTCQHIGIMLTGLPRVLNSNIHYMNITSQRDSV